jgi:hypothetical protein
MGDNLRRSAPQEQPLDRTQPAGAHDDEVDVASANRGQYFLPGVPDHDERLAICEDCRQFAVPFGRLLPNLSFVLCVAMELPHVQGRELLIVELLGKPRRKLVLIVGLNHRNRLSACHRRPREEVKDSCSKVTCRGTIAGQQDAQRIPGGGLAGADDEDWDRRVVDNVPGDGAERWFLGGPVHAPTTTRSQRRSMAMSSSP